MATYADSYTAVYNWERRGGKVRSEKKNDRLKTCIYHCHRVAVLLEDRFDSLTGNCSTDMSSLVTNPCSQALIDCLNRHSVMTQRLQPIPGSIFDCPNFLGCTVPYQNSSLCELFAGNKSLWCSMNVQQISSSSLMGKSSGTRMDNTVPSMIQFCLPASCTSQSSAQQLVKSQAKLMCDLWRFSMRQKDCGTMEASLMCGGKCTIWDHEHGARADDSKRFPDQKARWKRVCMQFSEIFQCTTLSTVRNEGWMYKRHTNTHRSLPFDSDCCWHCSPKYLR